MGLVRSMLSLRAGAMFGIEVLKHGGTELTEMMRGRIRRALCDSVFERSSYSSLYPFTIRLKLSTTRTSWK